MNILIFLNLYLISTIDICWGWWSNDATITMENKIRITGKEYSTPSGKKYGAFMGIPYAEPPTVDKRFKVKRIPSTNLAISVYKHEKSFFLI